MEQDKITIKMNYCINPLMAQHVHIGGEFSIKPGQTAEQAWEVALERIEAFYREHFPTGAPKEYQSNPSPTRDIPTEPKDKIQGFVEAITTCTTIKALETFKKLVEMQNIPELYEAYSETKKRLDNEQH